MSSTPEEILARRAAREERYRLLREEGDRLRDILEGGYDERGVNKFGEGPDEIKHPGGTAGLTGKRTWFPEDTIPKPGVTYFASQPGGYTQEEIDEKYRGGVSLGEPGPGSDPLPVAGPGAGPAPGPGAGPAPGPAPTMPGVTQEGNATDLGILALLFLG